MQKQSHTSKQSYTHRKPTRSHLTKVHQYNLNRATPVLSKHNYTGNRPGATLYLIKAISSKQIMITNTSKEDSITKLENITET